MATDFNQVSQELAQDMELLRNSVQRGTSGLNQIGGISEAAARKIKSSWDLVGDTTSTFVKSIYSSDSALGAMAATTTSATTGVANLAKEFGVAGKIFGFVIEKLGFVAAKGFGDLDKAFKGYSDLARTGATGAEGLKQFTDQASKLGYSLDTLSNFTALVERNSEALATFGTGMLDGVNKIAAISDDFVKSGFRGELRAMGMNMDDINGGITKYARILSITGQQDRMRGDQLTSGAKAYIKELDLLTKLTGRNAEDIQRQREARMQEQRMLAARIASEQQEQELRDQGRTAEAEVIKAQRENKQKLLDILPQNLATEFGALFEGLITNPQMASLMQFLPETTRYIQSGGRDMVEFSRLVNSELKQVVGKEGIGGSAAAAEAFNQAFGVQFADIVDAVRRTSQVMKGEVVTAATTAQTITDPIARAIGHLNDTFALAQLALQDFVRKGVTPITELIAEQVQALRSNRIPVPPYPFGPPPPGTEPPAAPVVPGTGGQTHPGMSPHSVQGTYPPGRPAQPAPAAPAQPAPAAPAQPAPAAPAQPGAAAPGASIPPLMRLFSFDPRGSGSLSNFVQLDPNFRDKVVAAATKYFELTGRPLTVNSAFRTREDQQRLYNQATVDPSTGRRFLDGRPVAPPGGSDHERGVAIDLQQGATGDRAAIEALNQAGLYQRIANDNVHFTARYGRMTSGPLSGYRATLHGNEVVIPLSNGTTIPLDMTPLIRNLDSNAQALSAQIQRLDDLIMLSRDTLNVNRKMLSYRG